MPQGPVGECIKIISFHICLLICFENYSPTLIPNVMVFKVGYTAPWCYSGSPQAVPDQSPGTSCRYINFVPGKNLHSI